MTKLQGSLRPTDQDAADEDIEFSQRVADFLTDLPDLSAWDMRAWLSDGDFYPEGRGANATDLKRATMRMAVSFLLGEGTTYFDHFE